MDTNANNEESLSPPTLLALIVLDDNIFLTLDGENKKEGPLVLLVLLLLPNVDGVIMRDEKVEAAGDDDVSISTAAAVLLILDGENKKEVPTLLLLLPNVDGVIAREE